MRAIMAPHRPRPKPAKKSSSAKRTKNAKKPLLTPSERRDQLRILLRSGWQSRSALAERLDVSPVTVWRHLKEIERTLPLESDGGGKHIVWRLPSTDRDHPLRISTSEMVALAFVKNALGFLAGTGIKEDIDAVVDRVSHALKSSDYVHWKNLDRKLFDRNEAAHDYADKLDVVNDVITALLREERVTLVQKDGARVKADPYTLVLYKKGLYLDAFSHRRGELRGFGLDKIVDVERHVGEKFDYPSTWDPCAHHAKAWGLIGGKKERVVVRFSEKLAPFAARRAWHATQAFTPLANGDVEMTVEPEGCEEMVSWVLGFGVGAEVIEPEWMRARVARELREALAKYEAAPGGTRSDP
jgi:proteasome accessory factor B